MSTIKVDTIKNTSNVEVYTAKAWVNFDGTWTSGDPIRASGNVTSITDLAVGRYAINFTTAITDANYSFIASGGSASSNATCSTSRDANPTTTSCQMRAYTSTGSAYIDPEFVSVAIFR